MNEQPILLFLELLRSAIWDKPADKEMFHEIDPSVWQEILNLAKSQAVNALIFDGVMSLPKQLRPERKVFYTLSLQAETIEKDNDRINRELKNLAAEYEKIDCPFVLLKGAGNATLYPNPKHRTPGDIDIYFYRRPDYRKANFWAEAQGYKMSQEQMHHQAFEFNGLHVENHQSICYFEVGKYDDLLEETVLNVTRNERFEEIDIDGLTVKVLPKEANGFFIFCHLFHHFIHLGIGFRQFIDWVLFMKNHIEEMDKDEFIHLAKSFDMLNAMEIFASAAVKYLGAEPTFFPFETDVDGKFVDVVMKDIFHGGNFGYDIFKRRTFKNELHRKFYSFRYTTGRIRKISGIAPKHINTLPLIKIRKTLKLMQKN